MKRGRSALTLAWDREMLTIQGAHLPGGAVEVLYIEAFCRPGSTRRDWKQTVIPHRTELVESAADGRRIRLRSRLEDGVVVDHEIRAGRDEVDFRVVASNPTGVASQAQWAQPCIRVDRYAGVKMEHSSEAYLPALLPLRRRPAGPDADAPLGPHGGLHARAGLVPARASAATTSILGRSARSSRPTG